MEKGKSPTQALTCPKPTFVTLNLVTNLTLEETVWSSRNDWGILVPEPLFLAEAPAGGVMFLGLQLGRSLRDGEGETPDDPLYQQWQLVHETLEIEGIRHNDARGNAVVTETNGAERLVAIDFESWEDLS